MKVKKIKWVFNTLLLTAFINGCKAGAGEGTENDNMPAELAREYPVTLINYAVAPNGSWQPHQEVFEKAPQRVVANTQSAAEFLLKLGLGDHIIGMTAISGAPHPSVAEEFNKIPIISRAYGARELIIAAEPDLVFGRGDLFTDNEWGVGTVAELNNIGIKTYLQNSSRPQATIESFFKDIDETGAIFDCREEAVAFAAELRERLEKLDKQADALTEEISFLFIFAQPGTELNVFADTPVSLQGDLLKHIKMKSAIDNFMGEMSREQFVMLNPDVLLIVDFDGSAAGQIIDRIYSDPILQDVAAVRSHKLITVQFNEMFSGNFRMFDAADHIMHELLS
jgi:iron complex transport system substrate-binding protein